MLFIVYSYTGPLLGEGGGGGGLSVAVYGRQICRSNVGFKVSLGKQVFRDSR